MRFLAVGLAAACALAGAPPGLAGQRHAAADSALAGSLLVVVPLPVSAVVWRTDTSRPGRLVRADVQVSRRTGGEVAGSRTIVGIRWDALEGADSTGWRAGVVGLRVAITRNADGEARPSAVELQLGGRSMDYLEWRGRPDVGFDLLLGMSRLDRTAPDFTVGIRTPVEWVLPAGPGRVLLSVVPTVAWGEVHVEGCVDDGPGDNSGDLGIQLEPGRTRFLLAGGVGYAVRPAALTLSLGFTRLMARGQEPRLALGLSARIGCSGLTRRPSSQARA